MASNQRNVNKLVDKIINWVLTYLLRPYFIFKNSLSGGDHSMDGTTVSMNKNLFIAISRLINLDNSEISFENIAKESDISKNHITSEYKTLKMLEEVYSQINKSLNKRAFIQFQLISIPFLIFSILAFSVTGRVEYLFIFVFALTPILVLYRIIINYISKNILLSHKILYNNSKETDEVFNSTYGVETIDKNIWDKNTVLIEKMINIFNLGKHSQKAFADIYNYLKYEGDTIYAQSFTTFSNNLFGTIEFFNFDNNYGVTYSSNLWEFVEDEFSKYPLIKNLDNSDPVEDSIEVRLNSMNALFEHLKLLLEIMETSKNSQFKIENFGITDGTDEAIPFGDWN